MKRIVTGVGPDGLSTVVSSGAPSRSWQFTPAGKAPHDSPRDLVEGDFGLPGADAGWLAELWTTRDVDGHVIGEDPGTYTDAPGGHSLEVPAGVARFSVVSFGPGYESTMHSTDSIDFDICISGKLELVLETGSVVLEPGDAVIVPGSRHCWRTDTGGAFAFVMLSPHSMVP